MGRALRNTLGLIRGVAEFFRPPTAWERAQRDKMLGRTRSMPEVSVPAVEQPTPWYQSRTQLLQISQTAIGIALALGLITPEIGTILNGNAGAIVGGVVAVIGAVTMLTHKNEVKTTSKEAAKEATLATAETVVAAGVLHGPGGATAAAKEIVKEAKNGHS